MKNTKITIKLVDTFSFAYHEETIRYSDEVYNKLLHIKSVNGILSQFDNNIRWNWKIISIELI